MNMDRTANVSDYLLLLAAAFISGLMAFHPYYFGDEILPFYFSYRHEATIWSIYSSLNEYKPRLIFNGIWAIAAHLGAPRYIFMFITVGAISSSAALAYYVTRVQFGASRLSALLAGAIIVTSRFAVVSYYDYVAGTIESLSALFFFLAVVLMMAPRAFGWLNSSWRILLATIVCVFAVFTHERYMAGTVALGIVVVARSMNIRRRTIDHWKLSSGLALSIVPVLLFAVATRMQGSLPLLTGTNGTQIAFSLGVFDRIAIYIGNVFFGLNNGHQWLVGSLQLSDTSHAAIIVGLACLLGFIYIFALTFERKSVEWRGIIEVCFLVGAMICVASLPDASRQEGRWMTPALMLLTLFAMYLGRARLMYLLALFVMNIAYLAVGSQYQIYNVVASRTASAIALPLNELRPEGNRGIILNAPNNGAQWTLGGYGGFGNDGKSGGIFSRLNFSSQIQVDPGVAVNGGHDFGLYYLGAGPDSKPSFAYIGHRQLDMLQHPEGIASDLGRTIAGPDVWKAWHWSGNVVESANYVELRPGVVGTWTAPAADLNHKLIVYRARAISGDAIPMRIQINWADEEGKFIGAFIKVVDVSKTSENFAAVVVAPAGAREGMVYANLHDGASGSVELSSIRLIGD